MASGRVLLASLLLLAGAQMLAFGQNNNFSAEKVGWIRFLVTVNDTWDPDGCIATVATDQLLPNKKYNQSEKIMVGSCDHGPLVYTVSNAVGSARESAKMFVDLTFYSSVIEDAEPPTCHIPWNGTYVSPRPGKDARDDSPLPGCVTSDSREGWYLTYYWFYLLDWGWAP
ncbi:PREDICTED: uncharacterized protein LOC109463181 isoform X1 [Branchiostoma belcheri]|uniref:Uncharacterized protein LOC109463181 isoform X1 n=1 Tax=Branchiostoma belcheri TaxID=7741 RepID=A0A6P4XYB0_BRABE|nr:PREDICTED: uncharacterized protein LOC109463181 isoform X1 [Branchiostoma belcheri]